VKIIIETQKNTKNGVIENKKLKGKAKIKTNF
jgi:hypothetical protein